MPWRSEQRSTKKKEEEIKSQTKRKWMKHGAEKLRERTEAAESKNVWNQFHLIEKLQQKQEDDQEIHSLNKQLQNSSQSQYFAKWTTNRNQTSSQERKKTAGCSKEKPVAIAMTLSQVREETER